MSVCTIISWQFVKCEPHGGVKEKVNQQIHYDLSSGDNKCHLKKS